MNAPRHHRPAARHVLPALVLLCLATSSAGCFNFVLPNTPERAERANVLPATVSRDRPAIARGVRPDGGTYGPEAVAEGFGGPRVRLRHPPPIPGGRAYPVEAALLYPPTGNRRSIPATAAHAGVFAVAVAADVVTSPVQIVALLVIANSFDEN